VHWVYISFSFCDNFFKILLIVGKSRVFFSQTVCSFNVILFS